MNLHINNKDINECINSLVRVPNVSREYSWQVLLNSQFKPLKL